MVLDDKNINDVRVKTSKLYVNIKTIEYKKDQDYPTKYSNDYPVTKIKRFIKCFSI